MFELKTKLLLLFIFFWGIQSCKVRVRLKLGFFSNSNILNICPVANQKVWVRLKLGVLWYLIVVLIDIRENDYS